jgi:hypothetical protein
MNPHVEAELLAAYASGDVDGAHAYSIEAHVVDCSDCQAAIGRLAAAARLQRVWADIEDRLDAPRVGPVEVVLARLGVPDHLARLLAATPSLSVSWLSAVALSLGFAAVAAAEGSERGLLLFLCVAALLPLAGVAAAFGRGLDPTFELAVAAPFSSVRLLLLRTAAVLPTTIATAALAALALPGVGWTAAAWLLPSLGLTVMSLALATYIAPLSAFGAVATAWLVIVVVSAVDSGDRLAAFDGAAQIAFVFLAAGAAIVLAFRQDRLELGRTP